MPGYWKRASERALSIDAERAAETLCGIPPMMPSFVFVCRNFLTRVGIPARIYNVA